MVSSKAVGKSSFVGSAYRGLLAAGIAAGLLWIAAAALIASHERDLQVAAELAAETRQIEQTAQSIAAGIRRILSLRSGIAATLAEDESIRRALLAQNAGAVARLNRFLAHAEKQLAVGALWVGDAAGKGFAAANAGTPESPIGIDYTDRRYFIEARAGRLGQQFAIGRTTRIPGLFFSAPIRDGGRFLGFVVVKIDLSSLAVWVNQADALLADEHGVIVLARDKSLEMRTLPGTSLWQLDAAQRKNLYRREAFTELRIASWGDPRHPDLQRQDDRDAPVLVRSHALADYGLTLVVTRPVPQLAVLDRQRDRYFALLAGIGLLLIGGVTASAVYLRYVQRARQLLGMQKRQLDEAQRLAHVGSWEFDIARNTLTWSDAGQRLFGVPFTPAGNAYDALLEAIHPDDRKAVLEAYRASVDGHQPGEIVHRVRLADGQIRFVHERWETHYDAGGKPLRSLGSVQDITESRQVEARLRLAANVFENAHEGIFITDAEERILEVNSTFCGITGYARADALGQTPRLFKSGRQAPDFYAAMWQAIAWEGHWQGELWNRRQDGSHYAARLTISTVRDKAGEITHYVGILSDITAARENAERLERVAHFDVLTGVPNRALLADRMRQAIAQTSRSQNLLAVCYLDLDGFKGVNDTHGHDAGDRLLVETAKRLHACLRGGDTVARLGGDEFVLLLVGLTQVDECRAALERILEALRDRVDLAGYDIALSASIGVTLYPQDNADADTLLRHADHAMYRAKQHGKNHYEFFDAAESAAPRAAGTAGESLDA